MNVKQQQNWAFLCACFVVLFCPAEYAFSQLLYGRIRPNVQSTSAEVRVAKLASRGKAYFSTSGLIAVPLQIGNASDWHELLSQRYPYYLNTVKIRSSPLLGFNSKSLIGRYADLKAGDPSQVRWIILSRGNNRWYIPESYFSEYLAKDIIVEMSDIIYSEDIHEVTKNNQTVPNTVGNRKPISLVSRVPFTESLSVVLRRKPGESDPSEIGDTNIIFKDDFATKPADKQLVAFRQLLDAQLIQVVVVAHVDTKSRQTLNFIVPIPTTTVYGATGLEEYWTLFKAKINDGDTITFTRREYLPIVQTHVRNQLDHNDDELAESSHDCLIKRRQSRIQHAH